MSVTLSCEDKEGDAIRRLAMEQRKTICDMTTEAIRFYLDREPEPTDKLADDLEAVSKFLRQIGQIKNPLLIQIIQQTLQN